MNYRIAESSYEYDLFVGQNGGSLFQTVTWARVKKGWKSFALVGEEEGRILIGCLCMIRDIKFLGRLMYVPGGFVVDEFVRDSDIVCDFADYVKAEMKRNHCFGIAADPTIVARLDGKDMLADISLYTSVGFKLNRGSSYVVQPLTEIVVPVKGKNRDELLKSCEKGVRHGYKTAIDGGCEVINVDGINASFNDEYIDIFDKIMTETSERVNFIGRSRDYYKDILFNLKTDAELTLIKYDRDKQDEKYRTEKDELDGLTAIENPNPQQKKRIEILQKSIRLHESAEEELKDVSERVLWLGGGITSFFGDCSECLYGGTVNLLRNTLRPTHILNVERLFRSAESGCEYHSMGRVTGDPFDKDNPLYGLTTYKRSYGGCTRQYVGDLYYSNGTGLKMAVFTKLFPKIRHIRATR